MVLGVVGVEPLVPPLPPTVPDELLPMPVLLPVPLLLPVPVVLPEPMLPVLPALPPVLEAPRSCRHLSFAAWSESFSQLARAEALSVEVPVVDELELEDGVEDEPALEESVLDEPVVDPVVDPELDGRDGEVVLEPVEPELLDPPVVWAAAMPVAPRKAAAIAACRIFIFIRCSSSVEWVLRR